MTTQNGTAELPTIAYPNQGNTAAPPRKVRLYRFDQYPTIHKISNDYRRHRLLVGPVGSGKTSWCCNEMVKISTLIQRPSSDGVRYSRWLVARNTYRELADTTIRSFMAWYPQRECSGKWSADRNEYLISGGGVHMEILFRSLDTPENVKKLLSLELTGAWLNEAREIPRAIFDMLDGRIGRYPSKAMGGAIWSGIILDTNPPDDDGWLARYFEVDAPETSAIYRQPSGLSDRAENVENLPQDYYKTLAIGKSQDYVNVYIHGLNGFVKEGKPVFDKIFNSTLHVANEAFVSAAGDNLLIGFDFGLTPAAVICRVTPRGYVQVLEELVSENMGIERFLDDMLLPLLATKYRDGMLTCVGDPAGQQRSQTDERTCYEIIRKKGLQITAAASNDLAARLGAVEGLLRRLTDGKATFQVSPLCKRLIKGFNGGYCYRRINSGSGDKYTDKPDKNEYSHVHDALQYVCMSFDRLIAKKKEKPYVEPPRAY